MNLTETKMLCPRCGTIQTILRKTAKQKKYGHYKKLYCFKCKDTHNHIELKDHEIYNQEEINHLIDKMKKEGKY